MNTWLAAGIVVVSALASTNAWAEPPSEEAVERSAQGLLGDVERIVDIQETLGWYVEEDAYLEIRDAMMRSATCAAEGPALPTQWIMRSGVHLACSRCRSGMCWGRVV